MDPRERSCKSRPNRNTVRKNRKGEENPPSLSLLLSFFFQWSRFKIMTEECRDYQCRCASLGSSGCRGDREKLFSMVMSPSQALLGSLRGSWCSVNDLFVNSAHVFLIRSVATSILSNYLLFQWEKRRGETTTTRVHVLSSKLFFILLAPFFFSNSETSSRISPLGPRVIQFSKKENSFRILLLLVFLSVPYFSPQKEIWNFFS